MKSRETIIAAFWILLGSVIAIWSSTFPFGSGKRLGPAVFPFTLGLMVILLGGILCFQAIRNKERYPEKNLESIIPEDAARNRMALTLLAMLAAAALFNVVGFVLTTFCLMLFLFRVIEPQRWRVDLFYVLIFTLSSYILFQVLLKVQLPTGFFGL
jgi:putative tricarboxylic transport membrane protein